MLDADCFGRASTLIVVIAFILIKFIERLAILVGYLISSYPGIVLRLGARITTGTSRVTRRWKSSDGQSFLEMFL